jgi:transcriptional regulator with XRE-family HTH domain
VIDGDRLRQVRESAGLSREQVAVAVGLTAGAITHYELGNRGPAPDTLARLCGVLGIEVAEVTL